MKTGLIIALCLGTIAAVQTGFSEPDKPDMSKPPTPNAKWLTGEFERRFEKEAWLHEEIGRLHARDQYVRHLIIDIFNREQMTLEDREGFIKGTTRIFDKVDTENTNGLKKILETYSWDDIAAINPELLGKAFHIVQHSNDEAFQAETLPVFKALAETGKVDQQQYALMYDRVSLGQGKAQRYGSQFECRDGAWQAKLPLEEPDTLDERRAVMNMTTMKENLEIAEKLYGECPDR